MAALYSRLKPDHCGRN